ncbi:hypothetical protein BZA70DRAFT_292968 [Myxozyma melibiosi]|uniref:Uncharacterized protein n=1 Tax=Myxozyma melibiosi TaxID=54550 RepID=A0ABR1FCP7_9ASCO
MSSLIIGRIGLCQRAVIGNASCLGLLQTRLRRGPLNAAFRAGLAQPYSTDKQASDKVNEISKEKAAPSANTTGDKPKKPRSPLVNFYATFTLPIIKVLAVVAVTFYTLSFVKYYLAHSLEEEKKEV